jgi:hypothetical protein
MVPFQTDDAIGSLDAIFAVPTMTAISGDAFTRGE